MHCVCKYSVATNLENLEYAGISLNIENSGNSQGILCNLGETKYFYFVIEIFCESAVVTSYIAGVDVKCPLMKVIVTCTFTFCCNNLW